MASDALASVKAKEEAREKEGKKRDASLHYAFIAVYVLQLMLLLLQLSWHELQEREADQDPQQLLLQRFRCTSLVSA